MADPSTPDASWTPTVDDDPVDALEMEDLALIDEVTHPTRGRILRRLKEPHTVAEVAELLDVPVTRLYHHVNRLEEVGLIRVVATRRVGAVTERRYQVSATSFRIARHLFDELDSSELAQAMCALFDVAKFGMQKMIEAGGMRGADHEDRALLSLGEVRLSPARRSELMRRLRGVIEDYQSDADGESTTLFIAVYPEVP